MAAPNSLDELDPSGRKDMVNAKLVGGHTYIHIEQVPRLDAETTERISRASMICKAAEGRFNVIKLHAEQDALSLLHYPSFFDEAFPQLSQYWTVDLVAETFRYRTYQDSLNPPILHRKELLLAKDHPKQSIFQALTHAGEQIGLFDDPNRIGFKRAWEALLCQRGFRVVGHELVPIGNEDDLDASAETGDFEGIARHRTALSRYGFSAPMQTLARFGFLDGSKSIFDYGCGRGDDLRGLQESKIEAVGWDPYFAPDGIKRPAHLVNLGFVINVIENLEERIDALRGAYALADELLVVSVMLANQDAVKGTPYGDGVLTSRNTFQKYYTQAELRQFIAESLLEEPLPVAPGIFYVFKNKDAEQRFMYGRLENRRNLLRLTRLSRPEKISRPDRAQAKHEQHRELLEGLWEKCLVLGRDPDRAELPNLAEITAAFTTLPIALRFLKSRKENVDTILGTARQSRIDDLHVYFSQLQFEKRKPYRNLEPMLQRDIKTFFGDYNAAVAEGRKLLFSLGSIEAIDKACQHAAEHGIGWLEESQSLQLHASMVEQLPTILRAYVRCGTVLFGDISSTDLIKIHIRSGKLTLMKFDDFEGQPLPRMVQRIKLNLRRQDLDVFEYGEAYEPPYLYRKSRFINEEFPHFAEQVAFEEALESLNLFDFNGYGPTPSEFQEGLTRRRYQVEGLRLIRSKLIPALDDPCGSYLKYRDLIECGETQARTGLANLPKEPESYTALHDLASQILDPVIEYFGMIKLSYGFCSPDLAKQIKGRIAPKLDQHVAHERNRLGNPLCDRLGAAVDFLVEDEDMLEVAKWVAENIPFDRMYVYGPDKPIHISFGPQHIQQVTFMLPTATHNRMPIIVLLDKLQQVSWPSGS
jgi:DNA phosphorothioation-associated putative methyltransferase